MNAREGELLLESEPEIDDSDPPATILQIGIRYVRLLLPN